MSGGMKHGGGVVVIGYLRVSTREQAESGAGLAAQRAAISMEADRRGWSVVWVEDAGVSGKTLCRNGFQDALAMLEARDAAALVVSKLDRLSRSMLDFAQLLALAGKQRWAVVALDLNMDTTTPGGEAMAQMTMIFAQWERRLIASRTRSAISTLRSTDTAWGRRMAPTVVRDRIVALSRDGMGNAAIARLLAAESVPAPRGSSWYPSTVRKMVISAGKQDGILV